MMPVSPSATAPLRQGLQALTHLGFAQMQLGEYDDAIATFERARSLAPGDTVYETYLVQANLNAKRFDAARKLLEPLRAARPDDPRLAQLDARALAGQGQRDEAIAVLKGAIDSTPTDLPAYLTLADLLRERLDLTATHLGCEHGVCGACTVIVDGHAVRSCTTLAVQADGAEILTLEGVAANGEELHPVQQAFWEKHGMQCGFCTPGIVMSLVELLERDQDPSKEAIAEVLGGHLCRCTGYVKIREAAEEAVRLAREAS